MEHLAVEIEREACVDRRRLTRRDRARENMVDRAARRDQRGRGLFVDEQRAFEMRNEQRPDRMNFGKMTMRRDRERLDHQMRACKVGKQLMVIAVGDLHDELCHFPAP